MNGENFSARKRGSLEGKPLDLEERIDLNAPDAIEQLGAHDLPARPLAKGEFLDVSEEITPEDEKELEETIAIHDEIREESEVWDALEPKAWYQKAKLDAVNELRHLAHAGFEEDQIKSIANKLADELVEKQQKLQEIRKRGYHPPMEEISKEEILKAVWEEFEKIRPKETASDEEEEQGEDTAVRAA